MKKLDTNSNVYTIIYATIIVVIVAVLLAVVNQVLSERQEFNKKLDVQKQILTSLNIEYTAENAGDLYKQYVQEDSTENGLPLFVATVDGAKKYVLRLRGRGLWGAIWGYIALNDDKNTIFGINFGHESETPGLGGDIVTAKFREQFKGKKIKNANNDILSVAVLKTGNLAPNGQEQVDALAGATITSTGVNDMLLSSLIEYTEFLQEVDEITYEEAQVIKIIERENNETK